MILSVRGATTSTRRHRHVEYTLKGLGQKRNNNNDENNVFFDDKNTFFLLITHY